MDRYTNHTRSIVEITHTARRKTTRVRLFTSAKNKAVQYLKVSGSHVAARSETNLAAEPGVEAEVEEAESQHEVLVEAVENHL